MQRNATQRKALAYASRKRRKISTQANMYTTTNASDDAKARTQE